MKKTILTITTAILFASCGNNAKNSEEGTTNDTANVENVQAATPEAEASLVGVWKLSDIDLGMEVPKGKEQVIEDMKKKMIAETVYTFNDDGTMTFKNPMVKETPATYTKDDATITITNNATKKAETVTVEELTPTKLVIVSVQGKNKAVMTFSK